MTQKKDIIVKGSSVLVSKTLEYKRQANKTYREKYPEKEKARHELYRKLNKAKIKVADQIYRRTHHFEILEADQKYVDKLWVQVLEHYGSFCACCEEKDKRFLTLDHVLGNGNLDRRNGFKRKGRVRIFREIINSNFPNSYQILCYDCNCRKRDKQKKFCDVHHPELYGRKENGN